MKSLGELMRAIRKDQDLTLTDVATSIGMSRNSLTNFEIHFGGLSYYALMKVCNFYNLSNKDKEIIIEMYKSEHDMSNDSLGGILRGIRYVNGDTQEMLAEKLGIHPIHLAKVEEKYENISYTMYQNICKAYNLDSKTRRLLANMIK